MLAAGEATLNCIYVIALLFCALNVPSRAQETSGDAQPLLRVNAPVLGQINENGTWNGTVRVFSQPCESGAIINATISFSNAKDSDEAMAKVKLQVDTAKKEAKRIAESCKKP